MLLKGDKFAPLLLDLSAAFDTVDRWLLNWGCVVMDPSVAKCTVARKNPRHLSSAWPMKTEDYHLKSQQRTLADFHK